MRIGYAVLVDDEVFYFKRQFELQLLQKFGANRGLAQPPHITIKGPFDADDLEWHANYLDSLASQAKPFTLHLRGIGFFAPHALFLDVLPHPELNQLTEKMLGDLPAQTYTPFEADHSIHHHATLAFPSSEDFFNQARSEYADIPASFEDIVEQLGLFYQYEDSWTIYKKSSISSN